jgi:hypothetical protein
MPGRDGNASRSLAPDIRGHLVVPRQPSLRILTNGYSPLSMILLSAYFPYFCDPRLRQPNDYTCRAGWPARRSRSAPRKPHALSAPRTRATASANRGLPPSEGRQSRPFRRPAGHPQHTVPPGRTGTQSPSSHQQRRGRRDLQTVEHMPEHRVMRSHGRRTAAARSRPERVLFAVKGFAGFSLAWVSMSGRAWAGWWAVGWLWAREWLVRRAGAWGVSWPRWRQSRSPVALPGPSRWLSPSGARRPAGGRRWRC